MKYDDAEFHFLNFEDDDLPTEAGATHIGLFFAWAAINGLASTEYDPEDVLAVVAREKTGRDFIVDNMDCKLFDENFTAEGNAFAQFYYETGYVEDYCAVFGVTTDTDDFCSVDDTWDNFDKLAPVIDKRFAKWKAMH